MGSEVTAVSENDPIREYQSLVRELMDRAERLRPLVRSCQEAIERSGVKAQLTVGKRNPSRPQVEIVMTCRRLDETLILFRELAKEGLRTDKSNTHEDHNIHNVLAMREYRLGPDVVVAALMVSIKGGGGGDDGGGVDGPSCRMEQVGVKEVPVYEIKCD